MLLFFLYFNDYIFYSIFEINFFVFIFFHSFYFAFFKSLCFINQKQISHVLYYSIIYDIIIKNQVFQFSNYLF